LYPFDKLTSSPLCYHDHAISLRNVRCFSALLALPETVSTLL
jgi:hypothetical protein